MRGSAKGSERRVRYLWTTSPSRLDPCVDQPKGAKEGCAIFGRLLLHDSIHAWISQRERKKGALLLDEFSLNDSFHAWIGKEKRKHSALLLDDFSFNDSFHAWISQKERKHSALLWDDFSLTCMYQPKGSERMMTYPWKMLRSSKPDMNAGDTTPQSFQHSLRIAWGQHEAALWNSFVRRAGGDCTD